MSTSYEQAEQLPLLAEPAEGVPSVITNDRGLQRAAQALAAGTGPVAVDAERASGFRYGQRAFLVQIKRSGSGIWLIDPECFSTLLPVQEALGSAEWILHASTQDLPCLAEQGMHPHRLFDTEVAARLAGLPRVGLGAVVENLLGLRLAKEHSAADWSTRPLPMDWLRYAALDVELLIELRGHLRQLLEEQGKAEWARQEFEHLRTHRPETVSREDRWRRTSGIAKLRSRRQLAVLRELWGTRENLAQHKDIAPGHLLPDSALVAASQASPKTVPQLLSVQGFHGRAAKREAPRWLRAIENGTKTTDLPIKNKASGVPPAPRTWRERNPTAFRQFRTARLRVNRQAEHLGMMGESLLAPAVLKQLCWTPPETVDLDTVTAAMASHGARPWQIEQTAAIITVAMLDPDPIENF